MKNLEELTEKEIIDLTKRAEMELLSRKEGRQIKAHNKTAQNIEHWLKVTEHSRISCSDNNPFNSDRCPRCAALNWDEMNGYALEVQLVEIV